MTDPARSLLEQMLVPGSTLRGLPIVDLGTWLAESGHHGGDEGRREGDEGHREGRQGEVPTRPVDAVAQMAAAFLACVAGPGHPSYSQARAVLARPEAALQELAAFWKEGLEHIDAELGMATRPGHPAASRLSAALGRLQASTSIEETDEAIWTAFFPQAVGIRGHEDARVAELRAARTVTVTALAATPIVDPGREVLITSNVLLTVPADDTDIARLPYPEPLRAAIARAAAEPQRYWFDHPIQIGVEPAANELIYGLRQLDAAVDAEEGVDRVSCVLSVSVTHEGLAPIARRYVEAELAREGDLRHLDVFVVSERATRRLVDEVLVPVLALGSGEPRVQAAAAGLREVVGVDGRYGRHFSFLKAVAALWQVAIDPAVRATFKIDLDQVFPQDILVSETGRTAFGHLRTPLWGATAVDPEGRVLELGMLAGALVNERDIERGLFTPDVPLPRRRPRLDEQVFFSALPQAISTRAEMMARYDDGGLDGRSRALERIHVTGGTSGIRVDALRRHRPFTPTFVGRAEDQAYILSVLGRPGPRLAYAHAAGLIMRHDKEAFAEEAMAAARIGKLIGDDERIVAFSTLVDAAAGDGSGGSLDRGSVGGLLDPFTGSFASALPHTVVLLRLALRTLRLFASGDATGGREYAIDGMRRINVAFETLGDHEWVADRLATERSAWDHYYDALDLLEAGIACGDERMVALRDRARSIMETCRIGNGGGATPKDSQTGHRPHR